MPFDLVGKLRTTTIIEGVNSDDHPDLATFLIKKCGPIEAWESVDGRLWLLFVKAASCETAKKFNGTQYRVPENKLVVRSAEEKVKGGKSILSRYSTAATVAPLSAVVADPASSGSGGPVRAANVAGLLLNAASGPASVKDLAAQKAAERELLMKALANKDAVAKRLMIGGPAGWDPASSAAPASSSAAAANSTPNSTDDDMAAIIAETEAAVKRDIEEGLTVKTSTDNLIQTEAERAAMAAAHVASLNSGSGKGFGAPVASASTGNMSLPLHALGTSTVPATMLMSDVDSFMAAHLRRQCEALLVLCAEQERALLEEIKELEGNLGEEDGNDNAAANSDAHGGNGIEADSEDTGGVGSDAASNTPAVLLL